MRSLREMPASEAAAASGFVLTPRLKEMIDQAELIEMEDAAAAGRVSYLARVFCQASMPYRNPGENVASWARTSGTATLRMRARDTAPAGQPARFAWAYGVIPRVSLIWINTQIVKGTDAVDGCTINFNGSLHGFMDDLGIPYGGKNVQRVRDQLANLAFSSLSVEITSPDPAIKGFEANILSVATHIRAYWSAKDPANSEGLFAPSITLSQDMYDLMKDSAVPLDLAAVRMLQRSGSGLLVDAYTWMTYRMYTLRRPVLIPWPLLNLQFGAQYKLPRQFKFDFIKALSRPEFALAYPEAKFNIMDAGLYLLPSPTSVAGKKEVSR